jgi:single-strand DNA-binding protein
MARSINLIVLLGNVGQAPERIGSGENVGVRFSIATSPPWKPEATEWHNIVAWRKLAEIVLQYVEKGSKVLVVGRLTYNQWTDQNGQKRSIPQIVADDVVFLSGGTRSAPKTTSPDPDAKDAPATDEDPLPF